MEKRIDDYITGINKIIPTTNDLIEKNTDEEVKHMLKTYKAIFTSVATTLSTLKKEGHFPAALMESTLKELGEHLRK
jgi:hypothetical protein